MHVKQCPCCCPWGASQKNTVNRIRKNLWIIMISNLKPKPEINKSTNVIQIIKVISKSPFSREVILLQAFVIGVQEFLRISFGQYYSRRNSIFNKVLNSWRFNSVLSDHKTNEVKVKSLYQFSISTDTWKLNTVRFVLQRNKTFKISFVKAIPDKIVIAIRLFHTTVELIRYFT